MQSGKGKVAINGEKFDISKGRLFLINTFIKPIKITQVNVEFKNGIPSVKYFESLAKKNKEVATFLKEKQRVIH